MKFLNNIISNIIEWAGTFKLNNTSTGNIVDFQVNGVNKSSVDANGSFTGNSASATKLATARNIALTGDVAGNVNFDGSGNASITATVVDDSHDHIISNVDNLQTALDNKVDDSQVLTNVPAGAIFTDTNTITTINGKTGAIAKADIVALGIPASDTNTTYGQVTTSVDGLMISADKTKLNAISGTNTGDETLATIKSKLGITTLSGSNTGDQTIPTSLPASSASSAVITTGLGFTPYNATNPSSYITSSGAPVQSVAGRTGAVALTKTDVGLANVNNTSDANKPVSTAQQTALNDKLDLSGGAITGDFTMRSAAVSYTHLTLPTTPYV